MITVIHTHSSYLNICWSTRISECRKSPTGDGSWWRPNPLLATWARLRTQRCGTRDGGERLSGFAGLLFFFTYYVALVQEYRTCRACVQRSRLSGLIHGHCLTAAATTYCTEFFFCRKLLYRVTDCRRCDPRSHQLSPRN